MQPYDAGFTGEERSKNDSHDPVAERLAAAAATLLEDAPPFEQRAAVATLGEIFARVTGIDSYDTRPERIDDIMSHGGVAITPRGAAFCLTDFVRASAFTRGLSAAIDEARRRFPGETIHVLYAGCGPYATLAVPIMTQRSPDEVRFTLLDIHWRSLDAARAIMQRFGLEKFVADYVRRDATGYRHAGPPFHVLVTETMRRALAAEPQAAITRNLVPQLIEGGILVPERITLTAALADQDPENTMDPSDPDARRIPTPTGAADSHVQLGVLFELTAENAGGFPDPQTGGTVPAGTIRLPDPIDPAHRLQIDTTIVVFGEVVLRDDDSSLTYPVVLDDIPMIPGAVIEFEYEMGEYPRLRHSVLTAG